MIVLVAGATGHLGRELLAELRRRGHRTRALVRDPAKLGEGEADEVVVADAATDPLDDACRGAEVVFSALGATSRVDQGPRKRFRDTDTKPNLRLLEAAERAGVSRFAYVALLNGERLRGNEYAGAHEDVVDALRASPVAHTVIRANGFFSAYDEVLDLARKNRLRMFGDPEARSNPVHDADLAVACADAIEQGVDVIAVGGPETMTRREEAELAYAAAGRPGKKVGRFPNPAVRGLATVLKPIDPRRAALLGFLLEISSIDMIGPSHGERRLRDYLNERSVNAR